MVGGQRYTSFESFESGQKPVLKDLHALTALEIIPTRRVIHPLLEA